VVPDEIEVAPDEVDVVSLFFALETQWRWLACPVTGQLVRLGLDYAAVTVCAGFVGVVVTHSLFEDLRAMEKEAVTVSAELLR
jgi:Phage related hypothetical protein (DUF1799)